MLPSTKLFKTINCPFYEADSDSCNRPYCHFNHAKPENPPETSTTVKSQQSNQTLIQPIPVYIPTPKHILEARKINGSTSDENASKRPKLEYVPKAITNNSAPIPTYTPSPVPNTLCDEYDPSNVSNVFGHDDAISNNIDGDSNGDDISGLLTELSSEQITKSENNTENMIDNSKVFNELTDSKGSKENHHKSSSSSSRHRHHSSDSSNNKDRKSSRSSSKSSSSTHKSSSHHSSHKSKHSDKSKDKERSRHSKSSKDSKSKSSKSSSSSSSSRHHSDKKTHSTNNSNYSEKEDCINSSVINDTDSEDDDVEAQCRIIFEEFDPSTIEKTCVDTSNGLSLSSAEEDGNDSSTKIDDVTKKKRVAHENANNQVNPITLFKSKPNHTKNAMQSVFLRQEIVRKQQEAKKEQDRKEQEKRELLKSLESDKPEPKVQAPKLNLTPLISPAAINPPKMISKIFAPVSNMLAIERAKEKVLQLKQQKMAQHQQFIPKTIAQTAVKGSGRVAHTNTTTTINTNANTANPLVKAAPPVLEAHSTKISYNIRSQYYGLMVKHCLTIYDNGEDAFERAQTEEYAVFKKCNTVVIYKSSACLTVNKLRKEALEAGNVNTEKNKTISHDVILAGKHGQNTSWNLKRKPSTDGSTNIIDNVSSSKAYTMIAELCLNEDQLKENGYPRSGNKPGFAIIYKKQGASPANADDRYCRRCGKVYKLDEYDENCVDRCNYHPKSPGFRRGFADNSHRCCQQPAGSPGCMYANYHVTDYLDPNNLTGFIKTIACDDEFVPTRKDIFALDCEMCYTIVGLELTRVTVVDINRKIVYDALVKPDNRIIDYNTTYSGISEKTLQNVNRTLRDVQAVLLSMFNSKTILVGHSLESDFKALKLIHDSVVDTSILYPHKMGPPKKRALKTLCIENLKKIIQEDDGGHNSAEDAEVCIDLIKHYLRNRIK